MLLEEETVWAEGEERPEVVSSMERMAICQRTVRSHCRVTMMSACCIAGSMDTSARHWESSSSLGGVSWVFV